MKDEITCPSCGSDRTEARVCVHAVRLRCKMCGSSSCAIDLDKPNEWPFLSAQESLQAATARAYRVWVDPSLYNALNGNMMA